MATRKKTLCPFNHIPRHFDAENLKSADNWLPSVAQLATWCYPNSWLPIFGLSQDHALTYHMEQSKAMIYSFSPRAYRIWKGGSVFGKSAWSQWKRIQGSSIIGVVGRFSDLNWHSPVRQAWITNLAARDRRHGWVQPEAQDFGYSMNFLSWMHTLRSLGSAPKVWVLRVYGFSGFSGFSERASCGRKSWLLSLDQSLKFWVLGLEFENSFASFTPAPSFPRNT